MRRKYCLNLMYITLLVKESEEKYMPVELFDQAL